MNEQQNLITPNNNYNQQTNLPNATASLVLGIISIVTSICYVSALIGVICGVIGLVLGNKDRAMYQSSPDFYTSTSHSQSNAGRTCSIIGLVLAGLWLLFLIAMFIFVGSMSYRDWR
ncbi:MAG: DUF4190 domain-containing protein [Chitinophagaceae bacterium]|nr:DUF4190 domain-containing protein [Chitinophagaceae bacterium]